MMVPKFRCWDEPNKIMRFNDEIVIWNDQVYINGKKELNSRIKGYSCLSEHLMQSTGLKDKAGVEIFEGDVVKMDRPPVNEKSLFLVKDYVLGKVIFAEVNEFGKDSWSFNGGYTGYSLEVIGNIYENPELLEEE